MARQSKVSSSAGSNDNLSSPGELIDESLSDTERELMDSMRDGKEPPTGDGVGAAEPDDSVALEPDETPDQVAEREAKERAPAERGLLSEVQKERAKRKELESQLAEQAEVRARSDERLRIINEMMQRQNQLQAQPEVEPDKEMDPLAWYEWKIAQQDKLQQQLQAQMQGYGQQTAQMQFANQLTMQEQQYAASNPAYMPSINKLANHLDKMFEPMFPNPNERQYAIGQWTRIAVERAAQLGKNPAQLTFEIAQNAGLSVEEAVEAAQTVAQVTQGAPANGNGQPTVRPNPSLRTVNTARRASQSLSNVSGTSQNSTPTMEDIDQMSDEDFEAFKDRLKGKSVTQYFFNR